MQASPTRRRGDTACRHWPRGFLSAYFSFDFGHGWIFGTICGHCPQCREEDLPDEPARTIPQRDPPYYIILKVLQYDKIYNYKILQEMVTQPKYNHNQI